VTFVSATPGSPTCTHSGGTVTCTLGNLANTASTDVTIVVNVPAGLPVGTTLTNNASVSSDTDDPTTPNNATATTTVQRYADMVLSKSAPPTIKAGQSLSYDLTVTNNGPNAATNVALTDDLPAGVTHRSSMPGQGSCSYSAANRRVTCDLQTLANGAHTDVTIVVDVPQEMASGAILENNASVGSSAIEDKPGDESPKAYTTVQTEADLALSKNDTPDPVLAGEQLTYDLTVTNNGPSQATGVVLTAPGGDLCLSQPRRSVFRIRWRGHLRPGHAVRRRYRYRHHRRGRPR